MEKKLSRACTTFGYRFRVGSRPPGGGAPRSQYAPPNEGKITAHLPPAINLQENPFVVTAALVTCSPHDWGPHRIRVSPGVLRDESGRRDPRVGGSRDLLQAPVVASPSIDDLVKWQPRCPSSDSTANLCCSQSSDPRGYSPILAVLCCR
ncbi:hypothetical protein BDM02DRAFT_1069751 [Thelephora ganbajun]|uniref:Uncharacterized protein n=1 Tax=Thelephora ganbajun TaxID=370292 RepID=A0ACB6ZVU5_THEGA|nr:hypothetical protein BDM02DRAFT_1069751 [Thelephora ganbajun]